MAMMREVSKWMKIVAVSNLLQLVGVFLIFAEIIGDGIPAVEIGSMLVIADYLGNLGLIRSVFGKFGRNIDTTAILWAGFSLVIRIILLGEFLGFDEWIPSIGSMGLLLFGISSFLFGMLIILLSNPIKTKTGNYPKVFGIMNCLFLLLTAYYTISFTLSPSMSDAPYLAGAMIMGLTKGIILPLSGVVTFWIWGREILQIYQVDS